MAKVFNTSVTCNPKIHYMVDTTAKMKVFERLIDNKCYFTINRARQFGKSTSLNWILHNMSQNYLVVPISFETESDVNWQNDGTFFKFFCGKLAQIFTEMPSSDTAWIEYWEKAQAQDIKDFDNFSVVIKQFCKSVGRKVVLTIDEVDKYVGLSNQITPGLGFKVFIDKHGDLNMPLIINRFKDLMSKKQNKEEFLEKEGRFMFICFLKPIVNGTGFYYSEPENDDGSRMDLVVNYNRKEYVIELKIWHGTEYEISGREQISEYLTTRNLSEGYLVTFSFLKNKVVQEKPEWIEYGGKRIYEAVI